MANKDSHKNKNNNSSDNYNILHIYIKNVFYLYP